MKVNGDMISKNSEGACLGSALKEKSPGLAERESSMQRNEQELFKESGLVWPELRLPVKGKMYSGKERKREKRKWKISSDSERVYMKIL